MMVQQRKPRNLQKRIEQNNGDKERKNQIYQ